MPNRRHLLKLIASGLVAHTLDIDKLLWVPGEKTIFLPSKGLTEAEIVNAELERIAFGTLTLFNRDDIFYAALDRRLGRGFL